MSELRERKKPAASTEEPEKAHAGAHKDMDKFEVFLLAAADKIPHPTAKKYFLASIPYIVHVTLLFEEAMPYIKMAVHKWRELVKQLEPYKLHLLLPSVFGLIMCFFGGEFMTVIAAVEAYRQVGYETTFNNIRSLIEDWNKFAEADKKDDTVDADNDGIADVKEISTEQLIMRKTLLFLRVVDPIKVTTAFSGIQSGILAVVATLKLHFAKAITLGNSIGQALEIPAHKYVTPVMRSILPDYYAHWAEVLVDYSIHYFAISVAWFLQRLVSSVHSAIRGGLMFSRNIMEYTTVMGIYVIDHEESMLDEAIGYALAALGVFFQVSMRFALPFPLNILLLPLTMLDKLLMWMVNES